MIKCKTTIFDKGSKEIRWDLLIWISGAKNNSLMRGISFCAATHQEALLKTLKILQASASMARPHRSYFVTLKIHRPRPDEEGVTYDEQYFLSQKHDSPLAIMQMTNPAPCFVYRARVISKK